MPEDHPGLVTYCDHTLEAARQLLWTFACLGDEVKLHFDTLVDERLGCRQARMY